MERSKGWRYWVGWALLALGGGFCSCAWLTTGVAWLRGEGSGAAFAFAAILGALVWLSTGVLAWGLWRRRLLQSLGLLLAGYVGLVLLGVGGFFLMLLLNPPDVTPPLSCSMMPALLVAGLVWLQRRRK